MNKILILTLIFVTLCIRTRSVDARQERCPTIRLANGRPKLQSGGRLVRFRCLKGYELVGRRYMNCFRSQWDFQRDPTVPFPKCVKPGCRASSYMNAHFLETYRGAVVTVMCESGYTHIGPQTVYCNGTDWNEPFPQCKAINPSPEKACDFESSLCEWTQDLDGDWVWNKRNFFFSRTRTSPPFYSYNSGSFMLLGNSSSRIMNATERFFSPVFPAQYSVDSCFTFWYSIHGKNSGYLKVFVKPEGGELYYMIPPFWAVGSDDDRWLPGYFTLDQLQVPFQIVFEGRSLPGNDSFTAFDNVEIQTGSDCEEFSRMYTRNVPTSPDTTTAETVSESTTTEGPGENGGTTVVYESTTESGTTLLPSTASLSTRETTEDAATTATVTARRRANQLNFQVHMDPYLTARKSSWQASIREAADGSAKPMKSDGEQATRNGIPTGAVEAVAAVVAVSVCAAVAVAFVRRRRRKKSEKESMVEDSDVRFLTADEFLDFTLARPADDDL